MKNIKLYDLESNYHVESSSFEYPTVAYTKDTDKVWYMLKENDDIPMYVMSWVDTSSMDSTPTEFRDIEGWYLDLKYSNMQEWVENYMSSLIAPIENSYSYFIEPKGGTYSNFYDAQPIPNCELKLDNVDPSHTFIGWGYCNEELLYQIESSFFEIFTNYEDFLSEFQNCVCLHVNYYGFMITILISNSNKIFSLNTQFVG